MAALWQMAAAAMKVQHLDLCMALHLHDLGTEYLGVGVASAVRNLEASKIGTSASGMVPSFVRPFA